MPIEEAPAGREDGRALSHSEIGERPGRFGGKHVGRTPPGSGHVAESLDRVHRCDATRQARSSPCGTGPGGYRESRPSPKKTTGQRPMNKIPGQSVGARRVLAMGRCPC
jgi:hypothetical protein